MKSSKGNGDSQKAAQGTARKKWRMGVMETMITLSSKIRMNDVRMEHSFALLAKNCSSVTVRNSRIECRLV